MKNLKVSVLGLCSIFLLAGCGMNNTAKGGIFGGAGGAALGGILGQVIGHNTKSTAIGAAIGTAVGATAGVLIGKKMDKAKAAAAAVENAKVEGITDENGQTMAVKVTFDSGILFATNKAELSATAKNSLAQFAQVLNNNRDCDIAIIGHTDNTGSDAINQPLSVSRAQSVNNYLMSCGVSASQIKSVEGQGSSNPVASNATKEGRQQNRRVEVYMYASQKMIQDAESQAN